MTKIKYVDGFVLSVPKKNLNAYKKMSRKAGKIWKEYGALQYLECFAEDMNNPMGISFPKLAKVRPGEVVVFSWIGYKSKAHRNQVNKQVMKDPRLTCTDPKQMPFDCKRMSYGGFKVAIDC